MQNYLFIYFKRQLVHGKVIAVQPHNSCKFLKNNGEFYFIGCKTCIFLSSKNIAFNTQATSQRRQAKKIQLNWYPTTTLNI